MSKRSRRERREHQKEQALATGDVSALVRAVELSPRSAVPLIVRALQQRPPAAEPDRTAELDALAVKLCRELRRAGEPGPALTVAAAGGRRTAAFRAEEALAAFALGSFDIAAQIAAADEAVLAGLGPLLQAVRGEVAGATPAGAAPRLRALHAAARAVAHVVRGEIEQTRAIVKHIPVAQRRAVLAEEIGAAAGLQDPDRATVDFVLISASPRVPPTSDVRRLMAAEVTLDAETVAAFPARLGADPDLARRVLPARLAAATSPGTVAEIVRQVGVDVFDPAERAAAALYLGFSQLRTDPRAATLTLDRAIQLGGDLVEALRGKLLAALALAHPGRHGEAPPQAMRDAAATADRLAHALERTPLAGPLGAAAGTMAAMRWIDAGDARAALAASARARPHAGGKLRDALDLLEVDALALRSPAEAERRLDTLIAAAPGNVAAWKLKINLAFAQGEGERAGAILLDAAEKTRDPELASEVREMRSQRGQLAPFEGLVPGVTTAGALAAELARATRSEDDDPLPLAAACRDALGPAARLAFDAAAVVIGVVDDDGKMALARLRAALIAWRRSPRDLARIAAMAVLAGFPEGVVAAARSLDDDAPALTALIEVLAVAGHDKLVGRMLPRVAATLPRDRVTLFKTIAGGKQRALLPGVPDPEAAARELDLALAPEFSITGYLREEEDGDDEEEIPDLALDGVFGELLKMLGLPADINAVPEAKLRALAEKLKTMVPSGPPSPRMMEAILNILNESGVGPPGRAPRPPSRKR